MTIPEHLRLVAAQDWVKPEPEPWDEGYEAEYEAWERENNGSRLILASILAGIISLLIFGYFIANNLP